MRYKLLTVLLISLMVCTLNAQDKLYFTDKGTIDFTSDAPLEVIKAASSKLAGIVNLDDRTFSFSIPMSSFEGFNSALQRTHFNENYLETEKYPKATFNGKIIEEVDFSQTGDIRVRAKGKLMIHGVEQDRIIRCSLSIGNNRIRITSSFTVLLEDHDITIPSIVQQKIAEEVQVEMEATITPMK
jgi:polyisoprenoid-binding protein YceI